MLLMRSGLKRKRRKFIEVKYLPVSHDQHSTACENCKLCLTNENDICVGGNNLTRNQITFVQRPKKFAVNIQAGSIEGGCVTLKQRE
jgi:hypothetical protein